MRHLLIDCVVCSIYSRTSPIIIWTSLSLSFKNSIAFISISYFIPSIPSPRPHLNAKESAIFHRRQRLFQHDQIQESLFRYLKYIFLFPSFCWKTSILCRMYWSKISLPASCISPAKRHLRPGRDGHTYASCLTAHMCWHGKKNMLHILNKCKRIHVKR